MKKEKMIGQWKVVCEESSREDEQDIKNRTLSD